MNSVPESAIDRVVVCQASLDALGGGNYLEIGVCWGKSFLPIRARAKWGVDPAYWFRRRDLWKFRLQTALGLREERLFRMTSDRFFQQQGKLLERRGVDVALIDGLHTYEQTLQDVLHTLPYLKPGGVIVLHDCNPVSEIAATPADSYEAMVRQNPGWSGDWNGDVWKVIVHLRSLHPDLEAVVLDCDYGVGVVRQKTGGEALGFSVEQIRRMGYADLDLHRQEWLNLKPPAFFKVIEEAVRAEAGSRSSSKSTA